MYEEAIAQFLRQGAEMLRTEATNEAPVISGRLRGDITVFPQTKLTEISVGNTSLIDYAIYVYYGTKPHTIRPKKKKALKTPYGIFKKVQHPGTKANPYLDDALESLVRSGRLERLLGGFGDRMGEEMFKSVTDGLRNIKVE
ncbi:hypothetical protein [Sulfurimonas sp.]|uniref:hypothetical protein n=1 Tax=Sulfurimonas sp. TaxID=2022749 RepID=UPI0026286C47|nr:hypothetical protein [Sulfurimonas sp.]MDD3452574.1 hypothetical protein [Sulfurimonas sp.]